MRLRPVHIPVVLTLAAAASTSSLAGQLTQVTAFREALVDTFLIDSVWDDAYLETLRESTREPGVFEQDLFSDQDGTYQFCDGRVVHESDLWDAGAYLETETHANGLNYDFVNIPVEAEGRSTLAFTFETDGPRRFRLDVEIDTERTAIEGIAEGAMSFAGPGGTIFTMAAVDDASEQEQIDGWLEPGTHTVDAMILAAVDASPDGIPYGDPETSDARLFLFLRLFAAADVNTDGAVDVDDLIAVIVAWGPCPGPPFACPADTDGDGVVAVDDLVAVVLGWSR